MKTFALGAARAGRLRAFYVLTKPKVNTLIVFCAVIGMFLAVPAGLPDALTVFAATLGIACVAGAAAAMNCLIERQIDARMARTRGRPCRAAIWRPPRCCCSPACWAASA